MENIANQVHWLFIHCQISQCSSNLLLVEYSSYYFTSIHAVPIDLPFPPTECRVKAYWGSGGTAPRILDLDARWKGEVNFTTGLSILGERTSIG